jgi:hypothetical protein
VARRRAHGGVRKTLRRRRRWLARRRQRGGSLGSDTKLETY